MIYTKAIRKGLLISGCIIHFIANGLLRSGSIGYETYFIILLVVLPVILFGCYVWTRQKNRHWAFMFWGLLAPAGLLGISLLKDKSNTE